MRIASLIGAGLAVVAAAGCSAKSPAPFPDVASFCQARAAAECQIASTCGIDPDECKTVRVSQCNADATAAMTTGTREYVQANAQACIDVLNASNAYGGGSSKILFAQLKGKGSIEDVCGRVFSGKAAVNAACTTSYDCTGGNICSPVHPGTTLVCAPETDKQMGDFCGDPGSTCAEDTYCTMPATGGGYQCVAAKQEGQPCDANTPCVSTERCGLGGATGQTCEPRVGANKACSSDDDCVPTAPYCDPFVGMTCAPGLSFANGAPDCSGYRSGGVPVVTVADSGPQGG
jgi:hypothetical protein